MERSQRSTLRRLLDIYKVARERGDPVTLDRKNLEIIVPGNWDPFAYLGVGARYGPYGEQIVRCEKLRGKSITSPRWFRPKKHANHIALHSPYGHVVFIEVEIDEEKRAVEHPYASIVAPRAQEQPRELRLF